MIEKDLAAIFEAMDETEAFALSGSRTALISDTLSDYDFYLYSNGKSPSREKRKLALSALGGFRGGNDFFEEGDELILPSTYADIMYRDIRWAEDEVKSVWRECNARLGYTTCFIFNIRNSEILFDKSGRFTALKEECSSEYPEKLRESIIWKNLEIISGEASSAPYIKQIELAAKRGDSVSLLHRTAALIASYFDILFAYSYALHPGEKKLMAYTEAMDIKTPEGFREDIGRILASMSEPDILIPSLHSLIGNLKAML